MYRLFVFAIVFLLSTCGKDESPLAPAVNGYKTIVGSHTSLSGDFQLNITKGEEADIFATKFTINHAGSGTLYCAGDITINYNNHSFTISSVVARTKNATKEYCEKFRGNFNFAHQKEILSFCSQNNSECFYTSRD